MDFFFSEKLVIVRDTSSRDGMLVGALGDHGGGCGSGKW